MPTYTIVEESGEKAVDFDVIVTDENGDEQKFTITAGYDEGEDAPTLDDVVGELKNIAS